MGVMEYASERLDRVMWSAYGAFVAVVFLPIKWELMVAGISLAVVCNIVGLFGSGIITEVREEWL